MKNIIKEDITAINDDILPAQVDTIRNLININIINTKHYH